MEIVELIVGLILRNGELVVEIKDVIGSVGGREIFVSTNKERGGFIIDVRGRGDGGEGVEGCVDRMLNVSADRVRSVLGQRDGKIVVARSEIKSITSRSRPVEDVVGGGFRLGRHGQ